MRQNHYNYDQQNRNLLQQLRSWVPFQRNEIFAYPNQDIILRSRAIGREILLYFDFRRDLETSQQIFWNLFWRSLGMFMNQTTPPWPETDGGAGRSNYGRVRWYDRSKWLRKEAGTTLELRTSYEIRERRVCMKPQTKLDQRRNWGINLDLKTRWPETEKIRFDAPTQLYYWKEGMPTLRMFLFYFRFFLLKVVFYFFFLIYQTKQIVFAGNSSSPLNLAFRIFTYRRLGTSLFDETFEERPEKSIATALKIQTGWSLHLWITTRQKKYFAILYLFLFNLHLRGYNFNLLEARP